MLSEEGHPSLIYTLSLVSPSGIVQSDPLVPVDRTLIPSPPPRPKNPVFDDEEKSKLLAKLLKSKNPDDLQEANKLIKSMVKEVSGPWALGRGGQSGSPFPWVGLLFTPATSPHLQRPDNGLEEQEWTGPV